MGGVATNGPYFVTAAIAQAARLIRNEKQRMGARRQSTRGKATRRSKRTRRAKKNATHRQKYALQA
jgi:hypothetical protein